MEFFLSLNVRTQSSLKTLENRLGLRSVEVLKSLVPAATGHGKLPNFIYGVLIKPRERIKYSQSRPGSHKY